MKQSEIYFQRKNKLAKIRKDIYSGVGYVSTAIGVAGGIFLVFLLIGVLIKSLIGGYRYHDDQFSIKSRLTVLEEYSIKKNPRSGIEFDIKDNPYTISRKTNYTIYSNMIITNMISP